jgi:hypothetical protein
VVKKRMPLRRRFTFFTHGLRPSVDPLLAPVHPSSRVMLALGPER